MAELHDWQGVGAHAPDGYEWFYFDAEHAPTASAVFISIMGPNPFDFTPFDMLLNGDEGPRCPDCVRARCQLRQHHYGVAIGGVVGQTTFEAEGYLHLDDPASTVTFSPDPWELRFPGATVTRSTAAPDGLPIYVVDLDVDAPTTQTRVKGKLVFTATHREWSVPRGVLFEDAKDPTHQHCWVVHVPQAHVVGQLTVTKGCQDLQVPIDRWVGYHDHNWGTRRLADGYGRWIWGRALLDGKTVVAASIAPRSPSGEASQRVPQVSVVLSPAGPESELLTLIEPPPPGAPLQLQQVPNGIESPMRLSFGASSADRGHHLRFDTLMVLPKELPSRYQRRIASVTLTTSDGVQTQGIGVTETLVAANFP